MPPRPDPIRKIERDLRAEADRLTRAADALRKLGRKPPPKRPGR